MLLGIPKKKLPGGAAVQSSRPPLERMSRLHEMLQAGNYPNCVHLSKELEVSRKTVQRDLDFMRDRLELPIAYDERKHGYYYTRPVESIPALEVSEGELVALLIAQKALQQHRGTAYEVPLRSACAKIAESLGDRVSVDINDLASRISFKEQGGNELPSEVFDAVGRAVRQSRELAFFYKKLGAEGEESRHIRPYHMGCINNQWYVFGFDLLRSGIRTFALTRLRDPKVLEAGFERPPDFSLEDFLGHSLGVFRGGDALVDVRVRFFGWVAQIVRERNWHSSEKKTELAEGGLELEMRLSSLEEVERWVLSFGGYAQVLEPPELVDRMRRAAESMSAFYRSPMA